MTQPYYYIKKDPTTDLTFINALVGVIEEWLVQASGEGGGIVTKTLRIAGIAGVGSQVTEESLDIIINSNNHSATIAGSVVDLTVSGAAEHLAEQIIQKGAIALGLGSGLWVGITATIATEFAYSYFLEPHVNTLIDNLAGTVDVDIQIKSAGGEVLAGVLYKDGVDPGELHYAVQELLVSPEIESEYPVVDETMTIEVFRSGAAAPSDVFAVYDSEIVQRLAEVFFEGVVENLIYYRSLPGDTEGKTGNGKFIAQATIEGELKRFLFARTVAEGQVIDFDTTQEKISLPFGEAELGYISFHPSQIFADGTTLTGNDGDNLLIGTAQDDIFAPGRGEDYIFGMEGDDLIVAHHKGPSYANNYFFGGSHLNLFVDDQDTMSYAQSSAEGVVLLWGDIDARHAEAHNYTTYIKNAPAPFDHLNSIEKFMLTNVDDLVKINSNPSYAITLYGLAGTDTIDFSGMNLGITADLSGIEGVSSLYTFSGFEKFIGTDYSDAFIDGYGAQTYLGGEGDDLLDYSQSSGRVVVNFLEEHVYSFNGGLGFVRDFFQSIEGVTGSYGNDYFYADETRSYTAFNGHGNTSYIDDNGAVAQGRDIVDFRSAIHSSLNPLGISINLGVNGTGIGENRVGSNSYAFINIEQIIGSQGQDIIVTGDGSNWLFGWDQDDELSSGAGDDHLSGGAGTDILDGGSGNDVYYFGWEGFGGVDTILDSSGDDRIYFMEEFEFEPGAYTRDITNNQLKILNVATIEGLSTIEHVEYADRATFETAGLGLIFSNNIVSGSSIEGQGTNDPDNLMGGQFDDLLFGYGGADSLIGLSGNDFLVGGLGGDNLYGGDGHDSLYASSDVGDNIETETINFLFGEMGNDFLYGSGGGDVLSGGEGYDTLSGKGGDFLFGNEGEDKLSGSDNVRLDGGAGNDFLLGTGSGVKYIVSEGRDVILDWGDSSTLVFQNGSYSSLQFYRAANNSLLIVKPDGEYVIVQNHFGLNRLEYVSFDGGQTNEDLITNNQSFAFLNSLVSSGTGSDAVYTDLDYTGGDEDNIFYQDGGNHTINAGLGLNTYVFDYSTIYNRLIVSGDVDALQDRIVLNDISSLDDVALVYESGTMTLYAGSLEIQIEDPTAPGQSDHIVVDLASGQSYALSQIELKIIGGSGDLNGYSNHDQMYATFAGSTLNGLSGNDTLHGNGGADQLNGGTGDDTIIDGGGNDVAKGGQGYDLYQDGEGDDTFYVDQYDTILAGAGYNIVRVDQTLMGSGPLYHLAGLNIQLTAYEGVEDISFVRTFDQNNNSFYTLEYGGNRLLIEDYAKLLSTPTVSFAGSNLEIDLEDLVLVTDNRSRPGFYLFVEPLNHIVQDDEFYLGHDGNIISMIAGHDTVIGGDGQDYITMFTNEGDTDSLEAYGGGGNDYLWSAYGDDHLDGQDGNDILVSGYGNDFVLGGAGDDTITVEPDGVDFIDGGEGNDTISYSPYTLDTLLISGITVDLSEGTVLTQFGSINVFGIENVVGTDLEDLIIGDDGDNILDGMAGQDTLEGGLGDDTYVFFAEYGNDEIEEEGGTDAISFLVDQQTLLPYLIITQEHNDLRLEIADSVLTIKNHFSSEDHQVETLKFSDGTTLDLLDYASWYVPVEPQEFEGTATADVFIGTQTLGELVDYSFSIEGVLINLQNNFASGGYAEGDILYYIDHVIGSAFADFIAGNPLNNILDGGAGDDQLSGGAGDDSYVFDIGDGYNTVIDTSGFDTLVLGQGISFEDITFTQIGNDLDVQIASGFLLKDFFAGDPDLVVERIQFYDGSTFDLTSLLGVSPDDEFTATAAGETFDGGEGTDTVDYSFSTQKVTIDLQNGTASGGFAQGDILISIENIIGTDIANAFDTLYGNSSVNTLLGLAGDDLLEGGGGADILDGGAGKDTVRYLRSTSAVSVNLQTGVNTGGDAEGDTLLSIENIGGSAYNDVLIGDSNVNYLNGSLGNDTLDGKGGAGDILHGEHGNDTYIFTSGYAFINESTGTDRIVFSSDWQPDEVIVNGNFISFEGSMDSITVNDISLFEEFEFTGFGVMNLAALIALNPDAPDTYGDTNDNTFVALAGPEAFYGLGGTDTVSYENSSVAIFVDLVKGSGQYGLAERDTYFDIENIIGSDLQGAADTIYGNNLNNHIYGLAGNDVLEGGSGADTLDGGAGTDWARYIRSTSGVNINLETGIHTGGDAQGDTLINIERIAGSGYDDVLIGSANAEYLNGGSGNDIVNGRGGADELYGQGGADKFIIDIIDGSTDIISDFKISENDVIDLHELFTVEYDPLQHAINDFVQITVIGNNSYLSVDADGGGDNFVQVAAIKLVTGLNASALYESDNLILTDSQI